MIVLLNLCYISNRGCELVVCYCVIKFTPSKHCNSVKFTQFKPLTSTTYALYVAFNNAAGYFRPSSESAFCFTGKIKSPSSI